MTDRIPSMVFEFLRISRELAHEVGIVGCGLQLDDQGEYSWRDTTLTLDLGKDVVKVFLTIEGIPFDSPPHWEGYARVRILHIEEYLKYYSSIQEFLESYRKNRFLRLGRRALLPPWELDSRDSFILRMEESAFKTHFICDPRERISHSGIIRGETLHEPLMVREPDGLPSPGLGGWIRVCSVAATSQRPLT